MRSRSGDVNITALHTATIRKTRVDRLTQLKDLLAAVVFQKFDEGKLANGTCVNVYKADYQLCTCYL